MLVYMDILTGDELLSDSFPYKEIENGMLWEVEGKWVVKGAVGVDFGANHSAEGCEQDVGYIKLLSPKLEADKQELFKKNIEAATKSLLSKLSDLQL